MAFQNTNTDILVAGAFAAFSVDLLVYPLDTIKTRVQSPDYKRLYTNASTGTLNRSLFRGLYQGIGSVILATVPSCESSSRVSQLISLSTHTLLSPIIGILACHRANEIQQEPSSPPTKPPKVFYRIPRYQHRSLTLSPLPPVSSYRV